MAKFTEKVHLVFEDVKKLAIHAGIKTITIPVLETSMINLYKPAFMRCMARRDVQDAVERMIDTVSSLASASVVTRPAVNAEIRKIMEQEDVIITLPDFWKILSSSPNSLVGSVLTEDEQSFVLKVLKDIEKDKIKKKSGFGPEAEEEVDWHDYVTDLVEKAKDYKKPFIGREDVIEDTLRTLARMDKCNPCHVGEPGVGKTAVTLGLAKRIADGNVPECLKKASLFSVDLSGMLAGAIYRGQFEERLKALLEGIVEENEMPILFFDEIHMIVGAGASNSSPMDASNIIKPFLTEGKIRFIGATTYDEYRAHIEKDKALARRFQKIDVKEPSIEDAIKIIDGLKEAYGEFHNVTYTKEAIKTAVTLSAKFMNDRFLPDKAIDLIDEAGAQHSIHPELGKRIGKADIESRISKICNIPKITNEKDDFDIVRNLQSNLSKKIFGQDEAIRLMSDSIKLSKSGLTDGEKPICSALFVGPSGVGKTELAKQLAAELNINFMRFDMSEYQEAHSVAKLTGAPAGYVGYEDGGILTEAVRKNPHSVVLFDEIEKAHPDIYKVFLQMMDYGTLTDNKGRKADFRNCIIIMTSNAGATVSVKKALGFTNATDKNVNIDGIMEAVEKTFTPEFRNRLTNIVVFNDIGKDIAALVVKKELKKLLVKLKAKNINAEFSDSCIDKIVELGVSPIFGARGIQRVIDSNIRKIFVEAIIDGRDVSNCIVVYENEKFDIRAKNKVKT